MKVFIVGPDKRDLTSLALLKKAHDYFDVVLYVPYSRISITANSNACPIVNYKSTDLTTFDAMIPRIPSERNLFGHLLTETLPLFSPIKSEAYVNNSDRFLLMNIMCRKGIDVPKTFFIDSIKSAVNLIQKDEINFPASLLLAGEKGITVANTDKEAKALLGALKASFNKPVYIEEIAYQAYVEAYVIGNDVFALRKKPKELSDIFYGKGKAKSVRLKRETKKLILDVAESIGTDFAMIKISSKSKKFLDIDLNPNLRSAQKVINKNLDEMLLEYVAKKTELASNKSVIERLVDETKGKLSFGNK